MFNPTQFYEFGKQRTPFESTWKTDNTSTGSSAATQVKLPLISTGTYSMNVNWGDGTSSNITTATYNTANTHTYSIAGTYIIKITGICTGWQFNNIGDKLKILSIASWGGLKLTNNTGCFYGCSNLSLSSVTDILGLTGITTLNSLFLGCTNLTTINRITEWNTSNITNMASMFHLCSNFNQNVGTLNISNVVNFDSMFRQCNLFNNGGSSDINNWSIKISGSIIMSNMFVSSIAFNQPLNNWNTSAVIDMTSMFNGASTFNNGLASGVAGNMLWDTSTVGTTNSMFINATSFNQNLGSLNLPVCVDFTSMFQGANKYNNGGSTSINSWALKTTAGAINMTSIFNGAILFNQPLSSWNTSQVTNMTSMFSGTSAFNNGMASGASGGTMLWNMSAVTTTSSMFTNATSFNQDFGVLNLPVCTDFSNMFNGATKFNNGLGAGVTGGTMSWTINTTTSVNMFGMFYNATVFNQNISSWNLSKVTSTSYMFGTATTNNFNNGLGSGVVGNMVWDLSVVTTVSNMFLNATSFNQNLGVLNLSNCSDLNSMFSGATKFNNGGSSDINNWTLKTTGAIGLYQAFQFANAFNQPLNNWDISACNNLSRMFEAATIFNNGLANGVAGNLLWNTANVTNMVAMFSGTQAFNQNIGTWNVSNVNLFNAMFSAAVKFNNGGSDSIKNWTLKTTGTVILNAMFRATGAFNQPIDPWNTIAVTDMGGMFNGSVFNQPLSGWNVANVTDMSSMFGLFGGSALFNQDIGNWNVSNVTSFTNFMNGANPSIFSTANLDAIYNGWSTRPVISGRSISFGSAKYTAGASAGRAILTGAPNLWSITDGGI